MSIANDLAALKIDRAAKRKGIPLWPFVLAGIAGVLIVVVPFVQKALKGIEVSVAPVVQTTNLRALAENGASDTELSAAGYVVADRQAVLAAKITGRLKALNVREAQRVKAGEVVAEVEHHEIDAQWEQLKAEKAAQQAEVERLKKAADLAEQQIAAAKPPLETIDAEIEEMEILLADAMRRWERDKALARGEALGFTVVDDRETEVRQMKMKIEQARRRHTTAEAHVAVAEKGAEAARAAVRVAEAQVAAAQARIASLEASREEYFIHAPFDGVVTEKAAEQGEIIAPVSVGGQLARGSIVTVADWSSLQAEVDVAEAYIGRVKPGQRAAIGVDALPGETFPGKVQRILPRANRSKATVQVRVEFVGERDERILPDMGIRVKFLADDAPAGAEYGKAPKALCVPAEAVQGGFVWVVKDGEARKRAVKTGETVGEWIVVTEGLEAGEQVVTEGAGQLAEDGARVTVVTPD